MSRYGKTSASVMINADMIRADMAKMGVTAQQVSESMGVNKNYITNALGRKIVSEQVVWKIENALFKPQGTYCLPISKEPVAEEPKATPNADLRAILARLEKIEQKIPQEDTEKKMKELSQELSEIRTCIKSTNTWLARLYAVWTNQAEKSA